MFLGRSRQQQSEASTPSQSILTIPESMIRKLLPNGAMPPLPRMSAEDEKRSKAREAAQRQYARKKAKREAQNRAGQEVETRSAEIRLLPLGDEHEPLAVGAMGLESGTQVRLSASSTESATSAGGTLLAHGDFMSKCDLVLASQSPRRLEIVGMMGLADRVRVVVSKFEENLDKSSFKDPRDYAIANAEGKAREVAGRALQDGDGAEPIVVVGSDTIVDLDGVILEKPRDDEHAFLMLSSLSGRRHLVHSGVSVFTSKLGKDNAAVSFCETTEVLFTTISPEEIHAYIRTREPMDKSGSYGIQGQGGQFVRRVDGCYFNVMGFPMHSFSRRLAEAIQDGKA